MSSRCERDFPALLTGVNGLEGGAVNGHDCSPATPV